MRWDDDGVGMESDLCEEMTIISNGRLKGAKHRVSWDEAYKDSLELAGAEMWGMYLGMQIAWREGFNNLQVESDLKMLVDMIHGEGQKNQ
ncbi:hypothetical protein L195_g055649, partial [Trifolium pratense]